MNMSATTRQALRGKAHRLNPIILIGNKGLTEAVIQETDAALEHHELIKVKIKAERDIRSQIKQTLCERLNAECIQAIGQVCVLFRKKQKS